jgi:hypothetical protein
VNARRTNTQTQLKTAPHRWQLIGRNFACAKCGLKLTSISGTIRETIYKLGEYELTDCDERQVKAVMEE